MLDYFDNTEIQKSYITVIYEDKESKVSWYTDTSLEDTRFAILCACDSQQVDRALFLRCMRILLSRQNIILFHGSPASKR